MHKKGFTLVELLVVITILSILITLGVIMFQGNVSKSRDAARSHDLVEITNVLALYFTEQSEFPEPSHAVDVNYSGALAWKQGTFGESVVREVKLFGADIPHDPRFKNEFSYSTTENKQEYQIASIHENIEEEEGIGEEISQKIFPQSYAGTLETAYVLGNYNGFMVRVRDNTTNYFIASPSIISTDLQNPDVEHILTQQKLVYHRFFNLPASYRPFMNVDGGFEFNISNPVIFSGSLDDLKVESKLLDFNERLKYIYATTPTESFDRYASLLEKDGLTSLKSFLTRNFKIAFRTYFNCKDILDDGFSVGDGTYTIDPDGVGGEAAYDVFCDMTTDGGGWTRVGDNYITHGDFSGGTGILGAIEYPDESHTIVPLSEELDGNYYALHQIGNYSTHYKVPFQDIDALKPGYEIRMTLWRSDYGSGAENNSANDTKILAGKSNGWTLGGTRFGDFTQKMNYSANFGPGGILTEVPITWEPMVDTVTTEYLDGGILFDGYLPQGQRRSSSLGYMYPYSSQEIQAIDTWVRAGGFLLSTNDEARWDPLGEYYNMPSGGLHQNVSKYWEIQNIDHPIVNGSIGLGVDLRGKTLIGEQAYSALVGEILPDDIVLARDKYAPYLPTVILRKVGKGHVLMTSDEGVFRNMSYGNTFKAGDNEDAFAAAIMAYAIETSAEINPHEGYVFHNRVYYNDGTFSTNGKDEVLETTSITDGGVERVWTKQRVRHKIYKTPEEFNWYVGLDANNKKDLYFTGLKLELFYR